MKMYSIYSLRAFKLLKYVDNVDNVTEQGYTFLPWMMTNLLDDDGLKQDYCCMKINDNAQG